jgi:hypothetical protein
VAEHVKALDKRKRDSFVQAVFAGNGSASSLTRGYILRNPRLALWETSLLTLATLTVARETIEVKRKTKRLQMKEGVRRRRIARELMTAISRAQRTGDTGEETKQK